MTAAVFTPDGIVISTYKADTFYQALRRGEEDYIEKINIIGHPHVITFWDRYALVFHQADEFSYKYEIKPLIEGVMDKWAGADIPPIYELMPYIKKQIVDHGIDIMGIMGGYSRTPEGARRQKDKHQRERRADIQLHVSGKGDRLRAAIERRAGEERRQLGSAAPGTAEMRLVLN